MNRKELSDELEVIVNEWALSQNELSILIMQDTILSTGIADWVEFLQSSHVEYLCQIISIKDLIHILYPAERWPTYIRAPNRYFDGKSAMDVMLADPITGVTMVHKYLQASVQGGYF